MSRSFRHTLLAAASAAVLASGAGSALAQTQIYGDGSTLAAPTYAAEFAVLKKLDSSINFNYVGTGSTCGQVTFIDNVLGPQAPCVNGTGYPAGTAIHYGGSDAYLVSGGGGPVPNPAETFQAMYGYPLIQLPAFGTPVTIPFVDGTATAVSLTDSDLCGIFSGKLTNWNQTSAAGKVPAGAITVVFRGDGSGTTFLTTSHLAAVCNAGNSNITFSATTDFASLFGGVAPANFVPGNGSGGVRSQLLAVKTGPTPVTLTGTADGHSYSVSASTAIGYIGPDYTSIAPKSANTSTLKVASVKNATDGKFYQPTLAATTTALSTNVSPPSGKTAASNPYNWGINVPTPAAGYPIVGYTYLLLSQCYKVAKVSTGIQEFLRDQYNNANFFTVINNNGFVQVPNTGVADFVTAINADFLSNTSGFNLNFGNAAACTGHTGR
jgi:ABC-type phosphate transport system substrate-binding protein